MTLVSNGAIKMNDLQKIDSLVAEKVMNWHVWENEDGELMVTKGYGCYSRCPSFSTNIAEKEL